MDIAIPLIATVGGLQGVGTQMVVRRTQAGLTLNPTRNVAPSLANLLATGLVGRIFVRHQLPKIFRVVHVDGVTELVNKDIVH